MNSLIIMCFGVIFFMFLLIAIYWAFWFCGFIFFINCRNYLPFFWNLLFYSLYFIFLLRTSTRPIIVQFSSVQSLSHVWLFVTPWTTAHQASLSNTNTQNLLKLKSIELMMPPNHLFLCHPLLLLPSIFPSTRVFSNESVLCIRWPKYWNCRFSISPSNEYSGLISFRIGWLDLLAVQGPLKSIFQHHSSKASILLRFLYSPTSTSIHDYWKTIALTRQTFVGKMVSLLFNMLSRLVISFLPRSKHFLISWLQSPSAVILEPPKIKSVTVSIVSPSLCCEVMGPGSMMLVFWMLSL